ISVFVVVRTSFCSSYTLQLVGFSSRFQLYFWFCFATRKRVGHRRATLQMELEYIRCATDGCVEQTYLAKSTSSTVNWFH
ncbi:hypothetical protein M5D96_011815, partial [Drosophila gunungcola]